MVAVLGEQHPWWDVEVRQPRQVEGEQVIMA
jgi:hypothetical protein